MKKPVIQLFVILALTLTTLHYAQADVLRWADLTDEHWKLLEDKKMDEIILEFRKDEKIPIEFSILGDLLQTEKQEPKTVLQVQRNFWVKFDNDQIALSLNGEQFQPIPDLLSGVIHLGANPIKNKHDAKNAGLFLQLFHTLKM